MASALRLEAVSAYRDESDIAGSEIAPPIHFRIREQTREERMGPSASSPPSGAGLQPILIGERAQRLYVLKPENIDYIQADGNYVKLRAGSAEYISRDAISRLTAVLAANGFVRMNVRCCSMSAPFRMRSVPGGARTPLPWPAAPACARAQSIARRSCGYCRSAPRVCHPARPAAEHRPTPVQKCARHRARSCTGHPAVICRLRATRLSMCTVDLRRGDPFARV